MKLKTAVVILNWNGKNYLEKFLPSVISFTPDGADIIVADNASIDDSIAFLKSTFPDIKIIQNSSNGGFAKGYNDALKLIDAQYYVLLNSDVQVTENWIAPIIQMMDNDLEIAACQPKIRSYDNKKLFEYAGAAGGFIDKYAYPFCRGRIFNSFEEDLGQYDDVKEIFWATGACLFVRAEVYNKIGGFDEDFFAHMEEIDLCWRIKNLGFKIMYCPESMIFHIGGGTLSSVSPQKTYLNFRNNLILLCKNHSSQYFWMKLFFRMILDGLAGLKFLLAADVSHFMAVLKAHKSFYISFGKTMKKRKNLKSQITNYTKTAVYRKSIVFDYFFRGKTKFSELDPSLFK